MFIPEALKTRLSPVNNTLQAWHLVRPARIGGRVLVAAAVVYLVRAFVLHVALPVWIARAVIGQ